MSKNASKHPLKDIQLFFIINNYEIWNYQYFAVSQSFELNF